MKIQDIIGELTINADGATARRVSPRNGRVTHYALDGGIWIIVPTPEMATQR